MELLELPPDKSQRPKERPGTLVMGEIPRQQDGPTASFLLPCSRRLPNKIQVMEHTAEGLLEGKSPREIGERKLAKLLVSQVEANTHQCPSPKLQL